MVNWDLVQLILILEKETTFKEVFKIKLIRLKVIFQETLGDAASQT